MLQKLSKVLSLFSPESPELSAQEIAKAFRWPKSTAYRLLSSIESAGFIDRDERTGLYRLGIRLTTLGELARHSTSLQRIASPALHRLSVETDETATLMLLVGAEGITVDVVESFQPLMIPGLLGGRMPLHATAGGKVFLAWASPHQRKSLIQPPLKRYTETTITSLAALTRGLDLSRSRGYTIVNGENVEDVVGVAAPIHDHLGEVSAALTVGGPRSRATGKLDMMADAVIAAAASVSAALGYRDHANGVGARRRSVAAKRTTKAKRAASNGARKTV